ncbi:hypothetical protein DFH08DRAFT_807130 [Mycena albidolilacea]|uniref:Uncharacterized protein n=1 Tax=Mycena albidolilacea TaxID=1033008 RepID=A0AAD7ESX6_9AGAR|nr:hypothetical protein DFH08DRAFT_807130 [Mycena albidolilacea]
MARPLVCLLFTGPEMPAAAMFQPYPHAGPQTLTTLNINGKLTGPVRILFTAVVANNLNAPGSKPTPKSIRSFSAMKVLRGGNIEWVIVRIYLFGHHLRRAQDSIKQKANFPLLCIASVDIKKNNTDCSRDWKCGMIEQSQDAQPPYRSSARTHISEGRELKNRSEALRVFQDIKFGRDGTVYTPGSRPEGVIKKECLLEIWVPGVEPATPADQQLQILQSGVGMGHTPHLISGSALVGITSMKVEGPKKNRQ